jgi:membrane protein
MDLIGLWRRARRLVQHDIWHLPEQADDHRRSSLLRLLRIVVLAARGFAADSLHLRASALTYYSLLSVVPTLALAFGIAKGFGLEAALEQALTERLAGQQDVLDRVIGFSRSLLTNTRGGIIAGVGVAVLMWSAVRLLTNIEASFNAIWSVDRPRSIMRRVTDYLAMAVLAPLLLLASSSAAVVISARITAAMESLGVVEPVSGAIEAAVELIPYVIVWLMLTLLYVAMPNTRVSWRAGLAAGVVSGTLFQIVQFAYINFVVNVTRYNAVYGSFAALPLFLIWTHVSWLIVLVGCEVSFAVDNAGDYARERVAGRASHHERRLLALRLAVACAGRFLRGEPPVSAAELSSRLDTPVRLVQGALHTLVASGMLVEVQDAAQNVACYHPARDPRQTTLLDVARAFDQIVGEHDAHLSPEDDSVTLLSNETLGEVVTRWQALEERSAQDEDNVTLADLAARMDDA